MDSKDIRDLYHRRAKLYDFAVWSYRLIGLREKMYRQQTVAALSLQPGDTVVDLACGTGLNFQFLQSQITSDGKIIGVDFTAAMLAVAQRKAKFAGWNNIEFIQADIGEYEFPTEIASVLSTFAISLVPNFDQVIYRGAAALRPGGCMAILDIKTPQHWPLWMARLTAWVNHPFGVTLESTNRRPRESLKKYLHEVCYCEYYFGYLYLSAGQKTSKNIKQIGKEESAFKNIHRRTA